ncbi:hypothetical protein TrRE_jg10343 [Triparma retinervis]|uniref:Fatty acid hydroxylase domain-containing protein n=1 Tax=Triparma retinervis TaxID=2557542 RepID=A0A9W7G133_9STRA|nr:hypothetical protein TrRE_jg10343 [Triparma retinervis]
MLWSGWENDVFGSFLGGGGGFPYVYAVLMFAWYQVLQSYSHPFFMYLERNFGPVASGPVLAWLTHMVFYHLHSGIYAILDNYDGPWTKKKVSRFDKMTYSQMLPNVVKNQTIFLVSGVASAFATDFRGWKRGSIPFSEITWSEMAYEAITMYLMYEFIFYWNHRILHITDLRLFGRKYNLYAMFHKEHHSTYASVGVSGLYMGSIDCVLTQTLPQVIAPALFNYHPMTLWLFSLVGSMNAVHTHSGFDFPGMSPPHGHELHHSRYKVNYGTGLFDRLCGTKLDEEEVVRENFGLGGRLRKDLEAKKTK